MLTSVKEIREIRKKLGLTQFELANRSGVSQSLIAKIEVGMLDPTYSNAMKIFGALNDLQNKNEMKAENIMNDKIISITPHTHVKDAISRMRSNGFSQLPVIQEHKAIGMISESRILDSLLEKKAGYVEEIMESPPPIVSSDSSVTVVSNLLRYFPMVIVSKKGQLVGVITKTDLLAKVYTEKK
jgi:predicted transcriptional regulator